MGTLFVVLAVPQGPKTEMLWEELVGGGVLEVLPAALEKVAGGPLPAGLSSGKKSAQHTFLRTDKKEGSRRARWALSFGKVC